jgi:glycosyltransferase involved in cell wall biosynthesis
MEKIVALIPAYNEEEGIQPVIEGASQFLPVWVVDDGSSDRTAEVAQATGAHVIRQIPNQGKGCALKNGFRQALTAGVEAVVTLDADGQHLPQEIQRFLAKYAETRADLIIGQRDFSQMPTIRRLSNTIGRSLFSWALRTPVSDNQSGYRLISTRLMQAMLDSQESGFELEVEMVVVCVLKKYRLEWVPISTIYAGEKSHIKPLQHGYNFLRLTLATRKRTYRIKLEV